MLTGLGYSAHSSLLAIVLAIGIVVDDANPHRENEERLMEEHPELCEQRRRSWPCEKPLHRSSITLVLLSVSCRSPSLPEFRGSPPQLVVTETVSMLLSPPRKRRGFLTHPAV